MSNFGCGLDCLDTCQCQGGALHGILLQKLREQELWTAFGEQFQLNSKTNMLLWGTYAPSLQEITQHSVAHCQSDEFDLGPRSPGTKGVYQSMYQYKPSLWNAREEVIYFKHQVIP